MKTVIKALIVIAVMNALLRWSWASWNYYQLRDAAQEVVTFGATEEPALLHDRIIDKASDLALPVEAEGVQVDRFGLRTRATISYTQSVELFPQYQHPFAFSFTVESTRLTGLK